MGPSGILFNGSAYRVVIDGHDVGEATQEQVRNVGAFVSTRKSVVEDESLYRSFLTEVASALRDVVNEHGYKNTRGHLTCLGCRAQAGLGLHGMTDHAPDCLINSAQNIRVKAYEFLKSRS